MANRKCMCCNFEYDYCPNCGSGRLAPAWKAAFCSETCKELWQTLSRFSMNFITKQEAKSVISELDLEPIESYVRCVQRDYAKVMEPEKKPKRGKRIEIQSVDEIMDLEQENVASIIEPIVEKSHEVVKQENE